MNTIVVYASMTGTTELMARTIADELTKAGDQVVVKDALETYAVELTSYERILVGSYTWGDGELSDEMMGFYDELENIDLSGKRAAAFGSGCTTYEQFASAVDILEEALKQQGCTIITTGLKADTWSDGEEKIKADCVDFVKKIITLSKEVSAT